MAIPQPTNPLGLPAVIPDLNAFEQAFRDAQAKLDADPTLREQVGKTLVGNPISTETVPSAARQAAKWLKNTLGNAQEWVEGVQRPSRDFKEAALQAAGKHKAKTQEALNEDRFAKAMRKVNVDEAIATAVAVGASGFAGAVQAKANKQARVAQDLQPRQAALKQAIMAMPQDTDQQREARMLAARRGGIEIGKARRG